MSEGSRRTLRIDLTGRVRIEDGVHVLDESALPGRQGRVVLACLALRSEPVHRDLLADLLWPDGVPATWERTLSGVISRLRSGFAAAGFEDLAIANAFGCYELQRPPDAVLDVEIAADETTAAERAIAVGDLARATVSAGRAIEISRRTLLAGEEGEWLDAARSDLRAVHVRALDVLAEASLGTVDAVNAAAEAIEVEPFRESSHVLLMRAHAALGNTADALLAYERCRSLLAEELGIDPSPQTQALHVALLRADEDALIETLTSGGLVSLPTTTTSFIGRIAELDTVLELITTKRLVTLTGSGGVGKTRLAIEAARSAIASFPDGVRFVDLATLTTPVPIAEHVALAVGLNLPGEATAAQLGEMLASQKMLLLLDNCEHVAEQVRRFVVELLDVASRPVVLATSRAALDLADEHVWDVPSLDVPDSDVPLDQIASTDAVALFCARASQARPGFALTAGNAATIASICRRLDGVPLAIELAASRIGTMGATELSERLTERFDFESDGSHQARHRTLRTAIDFSYDLLSRREAETFRQVSVFEASFDADDANAICADDVAVEISSLATSSLLTMAVAGDEPRFRMLETIKEYARERIAATDAWDAVVDRHIERYAVLIPELDHGDRVVAEARQSVVAADATMALERSLHERRAAPAVAIGASIWGLWLSRGPLATGRALLERVLELALETGYEKWLDWVFDGLGTIAQNQGDLAGAERFYRAGLEFVTRVGDEKQRAVFLINLAATVGSAGRHDEETALTREALALAEASGSAFAAGRAHMVLGHNAGLRGDIDEARTSFAKALELFTEIGLATGIVRAESNLAMVGWPDERTPDWRERFERCIALSREHTDTLTEAMLVLQLGYSLAEIGEFVEGLAHIKEGLRLALNHGSGRVVISAIEQVACVGAEIGDATEAVTLFAAAGALREQLSVIRSYPNVDRLDALRERALSKAGVHADRATAEGRALTLEGAAERALAVAPVVPSEPVIADGRHP